MTTGFSISDDLAAAFAVDEPREQIPPLSKGEMVEKIVELEDQVATWRASSEALSATLTTLKVKHARATEMLERFGEIDWERLDVRRFSNPTIGRIIFWTESKPGARLIDGIFTAVDVPAAGDS